MLFENCSAFCKIAAFCAHETSRLMIGETLTHQKLGRPLLYPLNYGAKPLFHWRLLWASAARKMM